MAHTFTTKWSGGRARVLVNEVEIIVPNTTQGVKVKAIWDTGASATVITQKVVDDLGLKPTGMSHVNTANGPTVQNTYIVDVGLPNQVKAKDVTVTGAKALSGGCEVLIGMDIISLGDFSVTHGDGKTMMSFRIPSMHHIDYNFSPNLIVAHEKKELNFGHKIGRNDPCHCGGGKKYKNCHGKS